MIEALASAAAKETDPAKRRRFAAALIFLASPRGADLARLSDKGWLELIAQLGSTEPSPQFLDAYVHSVLEAVERALTADPDPFGGLLPDSPPMKAPEKKLLGLAHELGLTAQHEEYPDHCYEPGLVRYIGSKDNHRCSNLAHELAHYILAPPHRRKLLDFGLGISPDSMKFSHRRLLYTTALKEEKRASAYGVMIEVWAGNDTEWTLQNHNWNINGKIEVTLRGLVQRGLLTKVVEPARELDHFRFDPSLVVRFKFARG